MLNTPMEGIVRMSLRPLDTRSCAINYSWLGISELDRWFLLGLGLWCVALNSCSSIISHKKWWKNLLVRRLSYMADCGGHWCINDLPLFPLSSPRISLTKIDSMHVLLAYVCFVASDWLAFPLSDRFTNRVRAKDQLNGRRTPWCLEQRAWH